MGNHDLHLLAIDAGLRKTKGLDTIDKILKAPDRAELIDWLRHRPLALNTGKVLAVHAGVLPQWDLQQTIEYAQEVEKTLRKKTYKSFLANMYGNSSNKWSNSLKGYNGYWLRMAAMVAYRSVPDRQVVLFLFFL